MDNIVGSKTTSYRMNYIINYIIYYVINSKNKHLFNRQSKHLGNVIGQLQRGVVLRFFKKDDCFPSDTNTISQILLC